MPYEEDPTFESFEAFHQALEKHEYKKEHIHFIIDNDYVEATYWPDGTGEDVAHDSEPEILFERDMLPRYVLMEVLEYLDVPHERP